MSELFIFFSSSADKVGISKSVSVDSLIGVDKGSV